MDWAGKIHFSALFWPVLTAHGPALPTQLLKADYLCVQRWADGEALYIDIIPVFVRPLSKATPIDMCAEHF